jgi:ribosomal protein L9
MKQDLRSIKVSQYNKGVAQEEGTDNDIAEPGPILSGITTDLDDEAEEYIFEMHFPDVVETLFESLDKFKIRDRQDFRPTERDHKNIKEKFIKLSQVFKTDHATLSLREGATRNEMKSLKARIDEILKSFKQSVDSLQQNLDTYDNHDIINELHSMEQNSLELERKSKALSETAKKVGSIDLEKRVYKLIEVMVLYVHILRNYEIPDKEQKPPLDDAHMETLPARNSNGNIPSNNNNNNEKGRTGGYLGEGQRMERWFGAGSEFIRRELSWPWNWEQTWKGVKQCFSILLMLTGLLIIFKSVFPIVSADSSNCKGQPMNPVASMLAKHSSLIHEERPTL